MEQLMNVEILAVLLNRCMSVQRRLENGQYYVQSIAKNAKVLHQV